MNDDVRKAWQARMLELMLEAKAAGCDPYDVLRLSATMGYEADDLIAVANMYELTIHQIAHMEPTEIELLSETEIKEGEKSLIAGVEQYLQSVT